MTPPPPPDAESVFDRWIASRHDGEDVEALCARHPEQAPELRELWSAWMRAQDAVGSNSTTTSIDFVARFGERRRIRLEGAGGDEDGSDDPEVHPVEQELRSRLEPTRYTLRGKIAEGGQGIVLKVEDRNLSRPMAMKVLKRKDEESRQPSSSRGSRALGRFLEEAQVTAQLDHPGIPPVHELGVDGDGQVFFTMKFVKGRDFEEVLRDRPAKLDGRALARLLEILVKVCDAMSYAHSKGVLHRDLKPSNVMVGRYGEVYVMDWGLARVPGIADTKDPRPKEPSSTVSLVLSARRELSDGDAHSPLLTMDGDVIGTPAYMSPEQAAGKLDELAPTSDVYAIGAMLYHVLVGHMPYVPKGGKVNHLAVWQRLQEGPPRPVAELASGVPVELVAVCEKAMARNPRDRYQSAAALAEDLRAFQEQRVVSAYARGPAAEIRMWVRRNRVLAFSAVGFVLAAFVAVALGAAGLALKKERDRERLRSEVLLGTYDAIDVTQDLSRLANLPEISPDAAQEFAAFAEEIRAAKVALDDSIRRLSELDVDLVGERDAIAFLQGQLNRAIEREGPRTSDWLERAAAISMSLEEWTTRGAIASSAWISSAQRVAEDPRFGHLELVPQLGLFPLGPDPASRLEEFIHVASGEVANGGPAIPSRDSSGQLRLGPEHGAVLVLLPGGPTRMGDRSGDGEPDEIPLQDVALEPFLIGKHELTFAQWERLSWRPTKSQYAPEELREKWYPQWVRAASLRPEHAYDPNWAPMHPVDSVAWTEAVDALRLSSLTLPTEAQWEYAARGDGQHRDSIWWCGGRDADVHAHANVADLAALELGLTYEAAAAAPRSDGWPMSAPVHRTHANPFGLHGVIGNLAEWCLDAFNGGYGTSNPSLYREGDGLWQGESTSWRVFRGGDFTRSVERGRSANRIWRDPSTGDYTLGLRVVRTLTAR